jgi:hypothetical protein
MEEKPTCPGCGFDVRGPYEAPAGTYFECDICVRHLFAEEVQGA